MRIVKITATLLGYLIVADIIGVVICTLFDIAPLRYKSGMLAYAIWLVLGVFAGLLAYNMAGALTAPKAEGGEQEWTTRDDAARIGSLVLWTSTVVLVALSGLFHWLYWSRGVAGEYFVPDSASHTIVFFVSVLGGMHVARLALMPGPASRGPVEY
jgi:sterol desaturase/sphingolipid hydroxylase (fatty acid hydroxylase superfamily)